MMLKGQESRAVEMESGGHLKLSTLFSRLFAAVVQTYETPRYHFLNLNLKA